MQASDGLLAGRRLREPAYSTSCRENTCADQAFYPLVASGRSDNTQQAETAIALALMIIVCAAAWAVFCPSRVSPQPRSR